MADRTTAQARPKSQGWAARFFQHLTGGRAAPPSRAANPRRSAADPPSTSSPRLRSMAKQLVGEDRYLFLLLREAAEDVPEADAKIGWDAMASQMALVPGGTLPVVMANGEVAMLEVAGFYLDRHPVTNRKFQKFVDAGGYDNLEIWPQEIWPSLMKFTDKSRRPGPRDWENGRHPSSKAEHPVVGLCWYEAAAYSAWAGKRLPTAAEWQKAGGWPEQLSGGACNRFPWGNVFEPDRANLWATGPGSTTPVDSFPKGSTPNGIHQMTGNVWEWLADPLDAIPSRPDQTFLGWRPMRRIIGGAYDTYFPAESTCQFVTGQAELDRRDNIGFRCASTAARLRPRV